MARVTMFHLSGTKPESLIPFYREVFGWEFTPSHAPQPTWHISAGARDEPGIDGMLHTREHDSAVVNTINVTDLNSVVESIESRGGRIIDRRTIPEAGELALFENPRHNVFQLRQPPENQEG